MVIATVRQCPRYVLLARHFARAESVDGPPGRRTGGGAPRFFAARRNGYPISCFIIGGRHRPKPTGRPRQSGRSTRRRRAVRSSVPAFTATTGCGSSGACPNAKHHDRAYTTEVQLGCFANDCSQFRHFATKGRWMKENASRCDIRHGKRRRGGRQNEARKRHENHGERLAVQPAE